MAWEKEEEEYLLENAATMTVRELHESLLPLSEVLMSNLKRTETIRAKCRSMGVVPVPYRRQWQPSEVEFLEKNTALMSINEMAKALGRTYKSVVGKRHTETVVKGFKMKRITPWMTSMLKHIPGQGQSIYDLSVELHRAGKNVDIVEKMRKVEGKEVKQMALRCKVRS